MSGTIGDAKTEKRDGALWQEEEQLQEIIETVANRFAILEKRLSPILRAHGPATAIGENAKEPPEERVPDLVQRLRTRKAAVQAIETKLASLLERLEI
jgi:hypothetical protein